MSVRRLLGSSLTLALVAGLLVASATQAAAATITVTSLADDGSGGCTLREAITNANGDNTTNDCAAGSGNDTISFTVTGTIPIGTQLTVNDSTGDDLRIQGPGANLLTLDGGGTGRVLFADTPLSLDALTVTGGQADFTGGGIYNDSTLTITNSTISGNTATADGGGIASGGGGGTLTITNSTLSGNTATTGGGVHNNSGLLDITNSTLSNNSASSSGGGIRNQAGAFTINGSTLSNNCAGTTSCSGTTSTSVGTDGPLLVAGNGGGIYTYMGSPSAITNSTISGNTATLNGGGVHNNGSTLTVTHSTFSGNTAGSGGGIHIAGGATTLLSTIVANNTPGGDCSGYVITDGGYNLSSDFSCFYSGPSQFGTDPILGPLADNGGPTRTHALLPGSPAIDQIPDGTNGCGTSIDTDQRGYVRPEEICDIGSYEFGADPPEVPPPGGGGGGPTLSVLRLGTGSGTVTSNPPGIGCPPDCSEQASSASMKAAVAGTTYVLSAHPAAGSVFGGWSGPCTGTGTCTVTLSTDLVVSATFDLAPPPPPGTFGLNVSKVGKGKVLSTPAAISCGQSCTGTFEQGTTVTLTANARQGWHFKRWRLDCKGQGSVCTLAMNSDLRAKAVFVKD